MKVGDLVTFSSYGESLDSLYRWSSNFRNRNGEFINGKQVPQRPLVGLVISIKPERGYGHYTQNLKYGIRWIGDGPKGRRGNYGLPGFYRKDLKFVSRSK